MKYGGLFLILATVLVLQAGLRGGFYQLLLWPGSSFGIVGLAYLGLGPRVFAKDGNDRIAWYSVVFLLPYLLLTWLTWHGGRWVSDENCYDEVVPGLFVGRRPLAGEIPEEVSQVVI